MSALFSALDIPLSILRPHLTPITQNLPDSVAYFIITQVGHTCFTTTIENLDITSNPQCTQLLISKIIGTAIVALSALVKLPQLFKLIRSRSARGISFTSYLLETLAYTITIAYNLRRGNPVSTFGEIIILAIQNVIVGALVLEFQGNRSGAAGFVAGMASVAGLLLGGNKVSNSQLALLQTATIPLSLASKVPQIWTVAREKSTGQLSAFAVFNYLGGSLARVFTTLSEVDDKVILHGFVLGAALNAVLAAQMVYYWNSGTKLGGKDEGEGKEEGLIDWGFADTGQ